MAVLGSDLDDSNTKPWWMQARFSVQNGMVRVVDKFLKIGWKNTKLTANYPSKGNMDYENLPCAIGIRGNHNIWLPE